MSPAVAPAASRAGSSSVLALGDVAPRFHGLPGADGVRYSLSSFRGSAVLVLLFVGNGCPSVKAYGSELNDLQAGYGPRGVQLVAVNANNANLSPPDTVAEMIRVARERSWLFPYLKDVDGGLARACGAVATPHAFVFGPDRRLRYRGRIADSRQPSMATRSELTDALDDLLAGRPVSVAETSPMGCSIVW